jgi:hypothetical protein
MNWVGTWSTTPVQVEGASLANQRLRMIAHVSIGGDHLHPSDKGYLRMGDCIDLLLFEISR